MKKLVLATLCSVLLSGCIGAFIAGAAAGGAIVYDRRNIKTMANDQTLRQEISVKISEDPLFKDSHIEVSSFNHNILLVGQTPKASTRAQAEKYARRTSPLVRKVFNEITIGEPSGASTRSSDMWITTKVKAKLLAEEGLASSQIKVVTENGVVYLMGIVSRMQANLAVDVARRIEGVRKIVKAFEYMNISQK